jgi:hypothetical protein
MLLGQTDVSAGPVPTLPISTLHLITIVVALRSDAPAQGTAPDME